MFSLIINASPLTASTDILIPFVLWTERVSEGFTHGAPKILWESLSALTLRLALVPTNTHKIDKTNRLRASLPGTLFTTSKLNKCDIRFSQSLGALQSYETSINRSKSFGIRVRPIAGFAIGVFCSTLNSD